MKTTTTVMDYLQSELINSGKNEFFNDNQLTFFEDDYAFIKKIMKFDKDVEDIVTRRFFQGLKLNTTEKDRKFKQAFVNKFLDRQFQTQTIESASSKFVYTFLILEDYINNIYDIADKYMTGEKDGDRVTDSLRIDERDNRYLNATLPQNEINMNVNDYEMAYADENNITRDKGEDKFDETVKTLDHDFDINKLDDTFYMFDRIFNEFDKNCFLHVW